MSSTVDPESILKQLRKLWSDLAREEPNGVLRACAMTLIVVVEEAKDAQAIGEMLAGVMHEHPSRAIVIRIRSCEERLLNARVFAQCWMPFGRRQQICCEQIEIVCSPSSLADVVSVVRALIVPDLPSVLFCPSETVWELPQFQALLSLAGKVIIDTCGIEHSGRMLEWLNTQRTKTADLVWSRLTPLRETIARIFDDPSRTRSVYDLSEVQMLYKGREEPSSVYYLAGWFMHVLGASVKLNIAAGVGPEYANIAHVTLISSKFNASVDVVGRGVAETTIDGGTPQVTMLPVANEYFALRQELALPARDVVFEDVLGLANLMRGAA